EGLTDGVGHLLPADRDLEKDPLGRFVEAVDVLLEAGEPSGIRADSFEDAVALKQTMVEDADLCVRLLIQLSTHVDLGAHRRGPLGAGDPLRSRHETLVSEKLRRERETIPRFALRRAERPGRPAGQSGGRALPRS